MHATVGNLAFYRLTKEILRSLEGSPSEARVGRRFLLPDLANAAVDTYLGNVRLVNALAKDYGFRAVFFWQPTIYAKPNLSEEEQRWYGRLRAGSGIQITAEEFRGPFFLIDGTCRKSATIRLPMP